MATETSTNINIANDPNFAVICAFLQKFGNDLGMDVPNFKHLQEWLVKTDEVAALLRDMHMKLMRKTRRTVHEKSWESALSKFCFTYSAQDAWEIERFGYKNASVKVKLRILRELLEGQFERNVKFRAKILAQSADSLRSEPLGRDRHGSRYWVTQDNDCNLRIYQEHLDEEIWQVVATSRDEFANLIERLRGNEVVLPSTDIGIIDEDTSSSNSLEAEGQKVPPEEQNDSHEKEQKVPKLSIKLNGRSPRDVETKDVGKGEEELAAEEDELYKKKSTKDSESCEEEFEEIEEEYDDETEDEDDARIEKNDVSNSGNVKLVEPLIVSQNKIKNNITTMKSLTVSMKKRALDTSEETHVTNSDDSQKSNPNKKARPSLLDSKKSKNSNKYNEEADGEELSEESEEQDENIEEDVEEEDIDSAAAEEDEDEEKQIEDFDEDDLGEGPVGNEISDPIIHVRGEGSGKECDSENNWYFGESDFGYDYKPTVGDAIEENVLVVYGEGFGKDCLVGNVKTDTNKADGESTVSVTTDEKKRESTQHSEDLKKSPEKPTDILKSSESPTTQLDHETANSSSKEEIKICSGLETNNTDGSNVEEVLKISSGSQEQNEGDKNDKTNKTTKAENDKLNEKEKDDRGPEAAEQAKNVCLSELAKDEAKPRKSETKSTSENITIVSTNANSNVWSRKRRLEDFAIQQTRNQHSESEIDINSEHTEEMQKEQGIDADELDIGGKRPKMRQKQNNSELRKKVEAQKAADREETTSSSGGEENTQRRRKLISPKKHTERILKTEVENKSSNDNSSANSTNGQQKKGAHEKSTSTFPSGNVIIKQTPSTSTTTNVKHKPTLAEIIEKKLKKTHELDDKPCKSTTDDVTTESTISPPKKFPVTKPLKKNLLTQIRQQSTDSEYKMPQSGIKDSTVVITAPDTKEKVTPERQRKRHSSEETDRSDIPEEPEAKKEVLCDDFKEIPGESEVKKENLCDDFKQKESICMKNPAKDLVDMKDNVKEEIKSEEPKSIGNRRSGRRGTLSVACPEVSKAKRTRGGIKKDENDAKTKLEIAPKNITNKDNTAEKNTNDKKVDEKEIKLEFEDLKPKSKQTLSDIPPVSNDTKPEQSPIKTTVKGTRKQRDVDTTNIIEAADSETPVRQSRRIAQQKIREEAERRKLEEIALRTMKQELKKKKKAEKQFDPTVIPPSEPSSESEESDVETKKKVQKKKCPGKNGSWSSGSEEQEEPDDEEYEEHHRYETDPGSPLFKSDHEFSPESDIEDETQIIPMKRARTVRKENAVDEGREEEEEACQKCNKSDHPEWILLCDKCDKGYHCSCLSPVLFYIPEGDWYCPPCQQEQLIKALEVQLNEFDNMVERKKKEQEEEQRLAEEAKVRQEEEDQKNKEIRKNKKASRRDENYSSDKSISEGSDDNDGENIGSNSDDSEIENKKISKGKNNVSSRNKTNDKRIRHNRRKKSGRSTRSHTQKHSSESDSDSQGSNTGSASRNGSSSSTSYSDSDNEPIYKLRKRRQINVSYRLNEYDDLINSALKKEMDDAAGAGNLGRGKDISTIIEADKEEKARQKQLEEGEGQIENTLKAEVATEQETDCSTKNNDAAKDNEGTDSDDEPITRISRPKPSLKKKSRKLTTLDISSEDDDGSDEDFKGSSIDDEEDTSVSASSNTDSSLEVYKRKDKSKKKQRKAARRAFRERRKDRKFIVDESDDDEDVQRPKSKKKRKVDSDYTESEIDDDELSDLSENIDSADLCDDTTTDESDGAWRPNKRKKSKKTNVPTIKTKPQSTNKSKKLEYSDDDISETEEEEDNDENESVGIGGGKQPRSQPLKTNLNSAKNKAKAKGGSSLKTKKKKRSSEEEQSLSDSADSTRRTRGRRYAYIEDFDDDSSDGGIKPGVQRPDTPPEEREKFIKRQEEIKRMLAEKNAEGAKLVATPRLTPIKSEGDKEKKSPTKVGGDSLSTVPLSVIRQAKVLDIDYLQRRGESLDDLSNDVGDVDDEFDDADLPDDLPEDMDEDAIARMVEDEEDFGAVAPRDIPPPDEVLRTSTTTAKPKPKEIEKTVLPTHTTFQTLPIQTTPTVSPSGLQEPVRKRLPMPTMHPPLLRHQPVIHDTLSSGHQLIQRHTSPQSCHLLQNALSAPLPPSLPRTYPNPSSQSHLTRMAHSLQMQPSSVSAIIAPCRASSPIIVKTAQQLNLQSQEKNVMPPTVPEIKPRGRRKKITPLRDTLQKQQTAAAVAAAASASTMASTALIKAAEASKSSPSSVIKTGSPSKIQQTQSSVITNIQSTGQMQSIPGRSVTAITSSAIYTGSEGYYGPSASRIPPPNTQRHRGPPQISQSHLVSHPAVRHSYGPPPPLKGTAPPATASPSSVRTPLHHLPPFVGVPPTARHSGSHLNLYGPSTYGNPHFGPRGSHRPSHIHSSEYPTGSRAYPPYGFYPPPPPLRVQQPTTSVIVSNVPSNPPAPPSVVNSPHTVSTSNSPESISKPVMIKREVPIKSSLSKPSVAPPITKASSEPRRKLTTLETFPVRNAVKSPPLPLTTHLATSQISPGHRANRVDDSPPRTARDATPPPANERQANNEKPAASEFSGLVSYFQTQHDDYNT